MMFNNNFRKCPTCLRTYLPDNNSAKLIVDLINENGEQVGFGEYEYCSETCLNAKLDTIGLGVPNMFRVEITKKEKISSSPIKYKIVCREVKLTIETA